MNTGLSRYDVKRIIQEALDQQPDLKYYINNPYIDEMFTLLIEGISNVIVENNDKLERSKERERIRRGY